MNQAIQILDGFEYLKDRNSVHIKAIAHGQIIDCFIEGLSEQHAVSFYETFQFDLEEQLTTYIEEEKYNEKGEVVLSASVIQA